MDEKRLNRQNKMLMKKKNCCCMVLDLLINVGDLKDVIDLNKEMLEQKVSSLSYVHVLMRIRIFFFF